MDNLINIINEKIGNNFFNFQDYLNRYNNFYNNDFQEFVNYWKGNSEQVDIKSLIEFEYLYNNYSNLMIAFQNKCKSKTVDLDFFDVADFFSDLGDNLQYIKNLPKYLKTSINFIDIFQQPVINYFVKDGDTLESIAKKFFNDPEQYSMILDYNNLDYFSVNVPGWIGSIIKIPAIRTIKGDVVGIIDGLVGENVLGKDIDTNFYFDTISDPNFQDIGTLEFEDCFLQSIENLLVIGKGTIPENPQLGNTFADILGRNLGSLSYTLINNDFMQISKQESTLLYLKINKIELLSDAIKLEFSFKSILDINYTQNDFLNRQSIN